MGERVVGIELDEFFGGFDGCVELTLLCEGHGQAVPGDRQRPIGFDGLFVPCDRVIDLALYEERETFLVEGLGRVVRSGIRPGFFIRLILSHVASNSSGGEYTHGPMEIRTLVGIDRRKIAEFLDAWPLSGGWTAGDRFRRHAESDPTWSEENVFVALEKGELIGTVSILPRRLQVLGHAIPTGGIGGLYTAPGIRERGVASELLERACEAMRSRGLELSVVFPSGPLAAGTYFEKRGWYSWGGQQTILRRDEADSPSGSGGAKAASESEDSIELEPVRPGDTRALQSVKSIHAAYAASRSGSVIRDDALWDASFSLTQAPREEFWIARRGGLAVAYARASIVDDVLTITELGRFEDGGGALARLIGSLLEPLEDDPLIPTSDEAGSASPTSAQLRSFVVLPTFDDIGLMVALEHRGIRSHPMDDLRAGFRCVNLIGLASRLDVDLLPNEDGPQFLKRILPPDAMVFWPADRF